MFFRGQRVATHARSYQRGAHTTLPEYMPKSHRTHVQWSPKRLIQWGHSLGPNTGAIVEHMLRSKPHPEQGYRACLGLLALAREYGEQRLENASALALRLASPTRKGVISILRSGRDLRPHTATEPLALELPAHGSVRGPETHPPVTGSTHRSPSRGMTVHDRRNTQHLTSSVHESYTWHFQYDAFIICGRSSLPELTGSLPPLSGNGAEWQLLDRKQWYRGHRTRSRTETAWLLSPG